MKPTTTTRVVARGRWRRWAAVAVAAAVAGLGLVALVGGWSVGRRAAGLSAGANAGVNVNANAEVEARVRALERRVEEARRERWELEERAVRAERTLADVRAAGAVDSQPQPQSQRVAPHAASNNNNNDDGDASACAKKLDVVSKRSDRMKRLLRTAALASLKRRWGDGPVRVRVDTSEGAMVIETAPFHVMPVTLDFWLSLVEEGYYSDTCFFRAEHHVIQATPESADARGGRRKPSRSGVIFQEYSPEYPHVKYTVGLAGRPGSTDWYVSMTDNIQAHGPGGQGEDFPGDTEADPCFGKVVEGVDVAKRIQSLPVNKQGGLRILKQRVAVTSATIVTSW